MRYMICTIGLIVGLQQVMAGEPEKKEGDRLLGIGINEGSIGFDKAFPVAQSTGMQFVELPQQWDEIESTPGAFANQWLDIANAYYPTVDVRLVISLNPIDTNSLRLPSDLKGKPFDHPDVIARYKKAVDYVFSRLPNSTVVAFSVGNEIDGYLGTDRNRWAQYERFFKAVSGHVRKVRPGVPIGAKTMMPSVIGELNARVQELNQHADAVFVTYYPLKEGFRVKPPSSVHKDIETLTKIYPMKPIYFLEAGYPSSSYLGSSESQQAEFVAEMFKMWDKHQKQIRAVNFIWLHDISKSAVDTYKKYYGLNDRGFGEYLGTLGLRTHTGKDKLAFEVLKKQSKARGW